jgi:Putative peptidoglycan binding domain
MRLGRILLTCSIILTPVLPALAISHARRGPTSPNPKLVNKHAKPGAKKTAQTAIDPQRASELQKALIKSGYLTGEPSGTWDPPSQAAMQKLQADNGWQTKIVPDSRAIIKLGLGPAHDTVPDQPAPPNTGTY